MIPNQRRWDYDVIRDIFNRRDSELILQIPLSSRRASDEWYWLADSKGIYSVRSCYKLLDSINEPPDSCIWCKIWKLEVPTKVKNFIWRAVANVVPTTDNLIQRRVEVNSICPICNASNESLLHILVKCPFAKTCWLLSLVGFVGGCTNFGVWLENLFTRCSSADCNIVAMICWSLWINRNGKVWRNKFGRVSTILNMAGQHLFQWQQAKKNIFIIYEPAALNHGSMYWERPREGWFKCNIDAVTFHSRGKVSFGAVISCSEGRFFAAKCTPLLGHFRAREAEAQGVK
ncbi:putative reverse transcriptase/RNA-dependent DNA polymerase [Citrus sinensis]|nr:putative reverse transcriptase/RNA-dependent DNA polymerase [Citrus sinensis]